MSQNFCAGRGWAAALLQHTSRWRIGLIILCIASLAALLVAPATPTAQAQALDRAGTLWAPYLEWSLSNPSYSGNPFDLIASATFVHPATGTTHTTQMFYAGGDEWRFRFTATRTGAWTFSTSSDDPELSGHTGTVTIGPNPDPTIKGFITSVGNKFARQVGENGELEGYLYNVYQDNYNFPADFFDERNDRPLDYIRTYPAEQWAREYLQLARDHGSNTIFIALANQWFKVGALSYEDHTSVNPELLTFEMLERVIQTAHREGGHVQIWMWGDNNPNRLWTQVGLPGGINGAVDQRLLRYIAARLGPLPGWTLGYGFDLEEWVSESETEAWARYLHDHFGWQHLVWARNRSNPELDAVSYNATLTSTRGPRSYEDVLAKLQSDPTRPHLEEERFYYGRWGKYDMTTTRRHFWWYAMAGGLGGHWGFHPYIEASKEPYPNPEQLATHRRFWEGRFLLDLAPANSLTDGYALKDAQSRRYVFYREDASTIRMNLADMVGSQPAIAIDTKRAYEEIDLGQLNPVDQSWTAPYSSDWAIAVGTFEQNLTDVTAPTLIQARVSSANPTRVLVSFSEALEVKSATTAANYRIDNGITVRSAELSPDGRTVTLHTSAHSVGTRYTLTVSNISDRAAPANTLAANTQKVYQIAVSEQRLPVMYLGIGATAATVVLASAWLWMHKGRH